MNREGFHSKSDRHCTCRSWVSGKATKDQLDDKTANAGDKNFTKYARDLDNLKFYNGKKQGVAWCDVFFDWCMVQAFGKAKALEITFQPTTASKNCGAGCKYSRNYYKTNGQLFDTPEPGDQIFFYNSGKTGIQHTGLVYKVDKQYIYTVEGNTSVKSGVVSNGGGVALKKYALNYTRLAGFGRPVYPDTAPAAPDPVEPIPEPTKEPTELMQFLLHTVGKKDTLWGIAKKYLGEGSRYKEIMKLNGMKSTVIKAGMVLKIPS